MSFQQSEVEPYLDKNIWNTLASNIPVDSMGYSKYMLPDSRDIINFVETWLVQHIANTDFAYRGKVI